MVGGYKLRILENDLRKFVRGSLLNDPHQVGCRRDPGRRGHRHDVAGFPFDELGQKLEQRPELRVDVDAEHFLNVFGRVLEKRFAVDEEKELRIPTRSNFYLSTAVLQHYRASAAK